MANEVDTRRTRREFLKDIGRKAAIFGLVSGTARLVTKPGRHSESCVGSGICRDCASLSTCGLPQALSVREAGAYRARNDNLLSFRAR